MVLPLSRLITLCLLLAFWLFPGPARAGTHPHRRTFLPVLTLHHVKGLKPSDNAIERGLTISPVQLSQELDYLARAGYHTVTAARLLDYLLSGRALPLKPVVLSFDDGYKDMYQVAYPILRRHHAMATFFIVPGFLGTPRYMTWRQVQELSAHGMDVEAHTMTHPDLTLIPARQAWIEVSESRRELERRLHQRVSIFAYPYGDYNPTIVAALRKAGYLAAFTTHQGWWQDSDQLLTLPRVYIDQDDTIPIFAGRLRADPRVLADDPT